MEDKDLKITALTQRIGELTSQYEDKIADLRVAVTRQEETIKELRAAVENADVASQTFGGFEENNGEPDVVEGEVI